jgi:molybdopterin/thiamine biosynthesis adenylyltransferase
MRLKQINRETFFELAEKIGNSEKKIAVVGAGATGSYAVWFLYKLGFKVKVLDYDKVSSRNIPVSIYNIQHIGLHKVDALRAIMPDLECVLDKVDRYNAFQYLEDCDIVVLALDDWDKRAEIVEAVPDKLFIDPRLGYEAGTVKILDTEDMLYEYKNYVPLETSCRERSLPTMPAIIAAVVSNKIVEYVDKGFISKCDITFHVSGETFISEIDDV